MENKYITVVESEDGLTLKDVYLWDKEPKKEGNINARNNYYNNR